MAKVRATLFRPSSPSYLPVATSLPLRRKERSGGKRKVLSPLSLALPFFPAPVVIGEEDGALAMNVSE